MQMHCQSKIPLKDSSSVKESPALAAIKSPGVSSAMSSLQLDESPSPASGDPKKTFSAANPNIFAPDLTRCNDSSTPKPDSRGSFLGRKQPFGFNPQQNQVYDEQRLRMLNSHQEMIRQQMSNSQRVFSHNTYQLSRLDPSVQQSSSFKYDKAFGNVNSASATKHPYVMQANMTALSRTQNASPHPASDHNIPSTTLRHQEHIFHPQMSDLTPMPTLERQQHLNLGPMPTLERQQHVSQSPMTDREYIEMLRANNPTEGGSNFVSALEAALGNPANTERLIRQAMQDQMRRFQERNRRGDESNSDVKAIDKQPAAKPAPVKSNLALTQSQVASLRQSQTGKDRFPKAVRRASAA
jgi:hypothetical protein